MMKTSIFKSYLIVDEIPLYFASDLIYIIANDSRIFFTCFLCPCGCEGKVVLPSCGLHHQSWDITIKSNMLITLNPSIMRMNTCNSCFELIENKVKWL